MGLAIGIGNGILFTSQRGFSSIIPGLLVDLCARATYCENKTCTTNTLESIAAVRYTPPPPPTGILLVDYPGASAAYSLRNLIDTTTNVVRVRRSSDNTEQNFTATQITDGTLTTFTGSGDGLVTIWYDQSGNSFNGVQSTATRQPKIVNSGILVLEGIQPSLDFTNSFLKTETDTIIAQPNTFFTIGRLADIGTSAFYDGRGSVSGGNRQIYGNLFGVNSIGMTSLGNTLKTYEVTPALLISTNIFNSTNSINYTNGGSIVTGNAGSGSVNFGTIGGFTNSGAGFGHCYKLQELILYPSNENTNRVAIETNINNHYLAYGDVINNGFLNTYQDFNGAYSLRTLAEYENGYIADVINVRRSSDDLQKDFTADEITDGSLASFVGAGNDGFVAVWYDQSLNQNHLYQKNTSLQPIIVESGNVLLNNSKPAVRFDNDPKLEPSNPIDSKNIYIVEKTTDLSPIVVGLLSGDTEMWTGGSFGTVSGITIYDDSTRIASTIEDLNTHLIVGEYVSSGALYVDGNLEGTAVLNSGNITSLGIRNQWKFTGFVQEFLISNEDVSANRTAIETNINNYYTIY